MSGKIPADDSRALMSMKMSFSKFATIAAVAVLAFPFSAAALEYNDGKITWRYFPVGDKTDEVCLGDGMNACIETSAAGAVTLPDVIDGKRVTVVSANAFKGCTKVTGVSILGNLEWIEEGAFDGATSLKTFGTLNCNENFFSYQGSLYAGDWENAELVRVPPALEVEEFSGLVKPHVSYVYPGAFEGCAAIQKIKFDFEIADCIAECSFSGCSAFAEFIGHSGFFMGWRVTDGALWFCNSDDVERGYLTGLEIVKWPTAKPIADFESLQIPDVIQVHVRDLAFAGNPLEKVVIPDWASFDSSWAFADCANLREVVLLGSAVDASGNVLLGLEDSGVGIEKVVYPRFPKSVAEGWERFFDMLKDEYGGCYTNIVYEKAADPNVGKSNITIPYTMRDGVMEEYDFGAYAKDLTTITFEGPCPDDLLKVLGICSNVTKIVYSANPIYRDTDYDWESWKSVMSWDWASKLPGRAIAFQEGAIPSETQFYFEDPECREVLYGVPYYDAERNREGFLSPIWPAVGELNIPAGVCELGEGALCGLDQVTKLVLPYSIAWEGSIDDIDENVGFETMFNLAEIEMEAGSSDSYHCGHGGLCFAEELVRVPPAYELDNFSFRDLPGPYPRWNALIGCRNIKKLTADTPDMLGCVLEDLDLTGCDQLVEFACNVAKGDRLSDYGYAIVDGAIYEDWGDGNLCLVLWPNAKRPIVLAENTVSVYCDAFRFLANPEAVTELTVPEMCDDFDLYGLAEEYAVSNVIKLVFKGFSCGLSVDLLEVMPKLSEIVYSSDPYFAFEWEWILEDFAGTSVKFTAETPSEPIYRYELDVWDEDEEGNVLNGECYLGRDGCPFVYPALEGAYVIPEKIENCRVVWAYENAFANMSKLTELTFPQTFRGVDAGSYREGYYDTNTGTWVATGEVDIVYSPFVGCTSLKKLAFNGVCPEGLWEVLEVTPSIKEVVYNGIPWAGNCGCSWSEFIAEFKAEHPDSQVVFTPLEIPEEPIWNVDSEGWLCGDYEPEEGIRIPCVWPDLVGEAEVPNGVYGIGENAFACMSNLTALTIPASVVNLDAGTYREGYYDTNTWTWVVTGEVDIAYSPFVGCTSLKKLTFDGYCPEGLWEVLEVTPSIREVYYNDSPWYGECGWIWRDFIAEFKAEHPEANVAFIALPPPEEPIWNIEYGELYGEYAPEDGWRVPCVWPDLVGEAMVPSNVYYIGANAFACMSNLTVLTIPASVEYFDVGTYREGYWDSETGMKVVTGEVDIVYSPFVGCTSLKKVVFDGGIPPDGTWELLELTPSIEEVVVPSWKFRGDYCEEGIFNEWLDWFVYDYKAEHPDSTIVFKKDDGTEIGDWEEYVPWKVEGDTMTVDWFAGIEGGALDSVDLSGVTKLVLPPYVDYVEDGVFGALKNLCEVEVLCSLSGEMSGYAHAFGGDQRLKLTLKPNVWWCCDCEECENAEDGRCPICSLGIDWEECDETCGCPGHWEIDEFAVPEDSFNGAEWIETLVIEEPAVAIADYAFGCCPNLKEAEIPASVEWMGEGVFAGCEKLENVYFNGNAPYGCFWLYDGASPNLVSYVKYGTTGWTGVDGEAGLPFPALWPVWEEDDVTARPLEYGKIAETGYAIVFLPNGGAGEMAYQVCSRDKVYNLTKCAFKKTGKTFKGWAGSNGCRYDDGVLVFNAADEGKTLTLTAIWQ